MKLRIGILGDRIGWEVLLEQIGVPFDVVGDSMLPNEYSVVVASDDVDDRESEMLRQYLALGGAVLCSVKVYARLRQTTCQYVNIEYLYPSKSSIFQSLGIIDVYSRCQLPWNANDLITNKRSIAAYVSSQAGEHLIALPFDSSKVALDSRTAYKSFYSPARRRPFEKVSLSSKGEIRCLVSQCLEILHHRRKLPFAQLWYYPNGSRSIFCFRIDTDKGTFEQIKILAKVIERNGIPATWFVDLKNHKNILKLLSRESLHEIGVHCYEHKTFSDYKSNIENINKALNILKESKISPKGFASPFGMWNEELGRSIIDSGFEYSSEFSYDYDNLPSVPKLYNRKCGVLQIPFHPICIGSLKRQSYTDKQMVRYFAEVIQKKVARREPLFFYHHPNDENISVLDWLFQEMRREHIPAKNISEYASWWKLRINSIPEFRYTKGCIHIRGIQKEKSLYIRITKPDGTEAIVPVAKQIMLETVRWDPKPAAWSAPDDFLRSRQFNYRIPLILGIDTLFNIFRKKIR